MTNFKKIKELIKKIDFDIVYDYQNNVSLQTVKYGSYTFEFNVYYKKQVKNYIGSTYLNPEEGDIFFQFEEIDDLYIYAHKNNVLDFSDDEIYMLIEEIILLV